VGGCVGGVGAWVGGGGCAEGGGGGGVAFNLHYQEIQHHYKITCICNNS